MNRLSVLSANFESTVNDVLGHGNFREIAFFYLYLWTDTVIIMHTHVIITIIKSGIVALKTSREITQYIHGHKLAKT